MRWGSGAALLCVAAAFTACGPDDGGRGVVETAAEAVEAVTGAPASDTWVVAATQIHSCAATADAFGFELQACDQASEVTPVVFAEFELPEGTCTGTDDVTFALSAPARSDAPDRYITIDLARSDGCEDPLTGTLVVAGRIDLTEASHQGATRTLLARRAVDQRLYGPPVLLLHDAQADLLVPWEPPLASHEGTPIER